MLYFIVRPTAGLSNSTVPSFRLWAMAAAATAANRKTSTAVRSIFFVIATDLPG